MATVKELEAAYGDKIRVVYRDLPLIQMHPNAAKAAEAGACANAQGKFWEMHDRMFANQTALAVDDLKRYAGEIGLDGAAFTECLDSGQFTPEWQKDSRDAQAAGVNTTPAFVINGRLLEGAQPYSAFAEVIDDELGRAGVAAPKPAAPVTQ
jgi:protein-disulfide isomerase